MGHQIHFSIQKGRNQIPRDDNTTYIQNKFSHDVLYFRLFVDTKIDSRKCYAILNVWIHSLLTSFNSSVSFRHFEMCFSMLLVEYTIIGRRAFE